MSVAEEGPLNTMHEYSNDPPAQSQRESTPLIQATKQCEKVQIKAKEARKDSKRNLEKIKRTK